MTAAGYWIGWGGVTLAAAACLGLALMAEEPADMKRMFLPGTTTDGHYQIELACSACHTPFAGVKAEACVRCHGEELRAVEDSHPKSKFTDPRNASLVAKLDARSCIPCHREHNPAVTRAMGITLPDDYCFTCHEGIAVDRPSHKGLAFETCASAGCHNYHDNTALYEDFLVAHAAEPPSRANPRVLNRVSRADGAGLKSGAPGPAELEFGATRPAEPKLARTPEDWEASAHARGDLDCTDCHSRGDADAAWVDRPDRSTCAACHGVETDGFLSGKHGMRVAAGLAPMKPGLARRAMQRDASDRELSCSSCHSSHAYDTKRAAVDACLECHADGHSLAYRQSVHYALWRRELEGHAASGSGVSCATCHLPRAARKEDGMQTVRVQHDQNANLRPNDKMIRTVCLNCHGLAFSIDALADARLVRNNFSGRPARHIESIDMAVGRDRDGMNPGRAIGEETR